MSLYNMLHGMNAGLAVVLAPFLPRRPDQFPRFRDVFLGAEDAPTKGDVYVYTRMGGGNRECWEAGEDGCTCPAHDADLVETLPGCVCRYDDDFDNTYSTFVFRVADEDRADFEALKAGEPWRVSDRYRERLRQAFAGDGEKTRAFVEAVCTATPS